MEEMLTNHQLIGSPYELGDGRVEEERKKVQRHVTAGRFLK